MKEEEKHAEAMEEETENAAPAAASTPEPSNNEEEERGPAVVPEEHEEPKDEDVGDTRQHLNVVFIGHVGTDLSAGCCVPVVLLLRDRAACGASCSWRCEHDKHWRGAQKYTSGGIVAGLQVVKLCGFAVSIQRHAGIRSFGRAMRH